MKHNSTLPNWTDVYVLFMRVADELYNLSSAPGIHETINKKVDELYFPHKGEPAWDLAYSRWYDVGNCEEV